MTGNGQQLLGQVKVGIACNLPVWVLSSAVGMTEVFTPAAERMGKATVKEQRPTQEIS